MNKPPVHIPEHLLPAKDQLVYLAISGGVDSVVLLDLLVKAGCRVHLLHVNYHLRGQDSDEDAKLVYHFINWYSLSGTFRDFYMQNHLNKNGGNLQAEARKARYDFFQKHVTKNDILMTAHHFDDQMETFFMHLSRKSGIAGMSCMAEKNGNHWRPLLQFRKTDLYQYAHENQLEFREDKSNAENKYLRNLWRNVWIPRMEQKIPNLAQQIAVLIEAFQNERLFLEEKNATLLRSIQASGGWDFDSFDRVDDESKFLIGKNLLLKASEMERLTDLRKSGKSKFIWVQNQLKIWNDGSAFVWEKEPVTSVPALKVETIVALPKAFDKHTYYADADKIVGTLSVRSWQTGDRIAPLGMTGTQLVSDIIKDAKVPPSEKAKVLVVEDTEKIIWVVGLKMGRLAAANSNSKELLSIKI